MVCVKNDDEVVSKTIQSYGSWDRDSVTKVMMAMEMYEDAVFIGKALCLWLSCLSNSLSFIFKTGVVTLVCIH